MNQKILEQLIAMASTAQALEDSRNYLASHLRSGVKPGERVLLCFRSYEHGSLGWLMEEAVHQCGGVSVRWGPDYRWKELLQQAFVSRASAIIGPPQLILGLTKLKKYHNTPLYIRNAFTVSFPCLDWMIEGIANGLDCACSGCFGVEETGIVAGFSCSHSSGVHIRSDVYGVDILDNDGSLVPAGNIGEMVLFPLSQPDHRFSMGDRARLITNVCDCGKSEYRLVDMYPGTHMDPDLLRLGQQLYSWTSILDCRISKSAYGLEVELVVFPGEKLPKLPSAAKLIIRPWNPKEDVPFLYGSHEKNTVFLKDFD